MSARETVMGRVRSALGRTAGSKVPAPPEALIRVPNVPRAERVARFITAFEKLNGKAIHASTAGEACAYAENLLAGRRAIASNAPFLAACGITALAGVTSGVTDRLALREACANYELGITSATYALAETGTLVMFSSTEEARMVSLLPPCHLAVVPVDLLLTGLDELLEREPVPSARSSSMVFITGPSRTADIEQILVRGVHGPGEIHVVLVG